MKKSLKAALFAACFVVLSFSAFARGKKDVEERSVEKMESWQETFDINEKKAGKYNVFVEAKDKGGNTAINGPFNLYIDPDSDYVISGITNPANNMRVPGNLNIVGTCVDDDGVAEVWLVLDGGEPIKADGKEFWSYYLDTTELAEGPHTIDVWGVDINGLSSREKPKKNAHVVWNLDRRQPITTVTNYSQGELVSGKITLKGESSDGNGIRNLYYSLDNAKTFEAIPIKEDKKNPGIAHFELSIDTKKADDGPAILWFKAIDKTGSAGTSSFLYFIDNTKPDVKIVSPSENEVVNGKFGIAGYAKDKVGLQKLSWSFNGESGDFELIPGNPYWFKEVDTIGLSKKSADFVITATDTAGNVVEVKKSILLNQEDDKPVVTVQSPVAESYFSGEKNTLFLRGFVSDDDGVASVSYSVDGGSEIKVESQGVFCEMIQSESDFSVGKHAISVYATDIHGVKGNTVTVPFYSWGSEPKFSSPKISGADATNGIMVHPEANPVFETSVSSESALESFSYKIFYGNDEVYKEEKIELKNGQKSAAVKIPLLNAPWGLVNVVLSATDIYGRTTEQKRLINIKDLTYIHEDLLDSPISEKIVDSRDVGSPISVSIVSVAGAEYVPGMNVILPYGASKNPASAVLSVDTSALDEKQAKSISVSYTIEGVDDEKTAGGDALQSGKAVLVDGHFEIPLQNLPSRITKISIKADSGKGVFGSCVGTICVVRPVPLAKSSWTTGGVYILPDENAVFDSEFLDSEFFDSNISAFVIGENEAVTGYANVLSLASVSLSFSAKTSSATSFGAENLEILKSENGKSFSIKALKDGFYKDVVVTAADANGKVFSSQPFNILADSAAPEVEIASPKNQLWVQNETELSVNASDANGIKNVEYSLDNGANWQTLLMSGGAYSANLNLKDFDDGLIGIDVRAKDSSGKITKKSVSIFKDTTPPEVQPILPAEGDVVNGDNLIAFIVKDNGRFAKAEYFAPGKDKSASATGIELELAPMIQTHVGTAEKPISDLMQFKFTDAIGNSTTLGGSWQFAIDNKSDLPIAEVHLPDENAIITRDFEISGVIYDDDGIQKDESGKVIAGPKIWYKIDDGKYQPLDQIGTSFSIKKQLSDFTDNEHSVTVYAEDINGVIGPEYTRNFRISLEEPKGEVQTPPIDETVKGTVKLTGVASDKNGIKQVYISLDNGNSYGNAVGTYGHDKTSISWSYEFDSRVVNDGTHVVFLLIEDWYGITGLYSSLINIDNTKPEINLELPLDDSKTTGMLFFSGQTTDNIELTSLYITIRSLDGKTVSGNLARTDLVPDEIITQAIDLSSLSNGAYNVEITGMDAANNITRVSRNIQLEKDAPKAKVDLLYPLNGEHVHGTFNIYGTAVSEVKIEKLVLFVDGNEFTETPLSETGYYRFGLNRQVLENGEHVMRVEARLENGQKIESNEQSIIYDSYGPWITIDSFTYGDFAIDRPFVAGNAGYEVSVIEEAAAKAKDASKEIKDIHALKKLDHVDISLDNGKTFTTVSTSGKWKYRIENEDIAEGYHFLLVRAVMKNGEVAVTRCIVQVDGTKPTIKLISPGVGGHYNQTMVFRGLANDDVALKSLSISLRKGDKAAYEIPGFIQGLYLDAQVWGATLYSVGAGLTFFDDNVKIQAQFGQFTQAQRDIFSKTDMRYGGNVMGIKLLANVYYLPFRYYFGPDWEWLSLNVALGANFSRFSETGSGDAQILSAGLVQLEFPRVNFKKRTTFSTVSFYTEGQLWFIPTDVSSDENIQSLVPQVSFGVRLNVF